MISNKRMEEIISIILLLGMFISVLLVLIGGSIYLYHYGSEPLEITNLKADQYQMTAAMIWQNARSLSSIGIIELGLLCLVVTQILRVGLLVWFYILIRDYWFTAISTFILLVLIYSLLWRH